MSLTKIFKNGIFDENPTFRLMIGICPPLAITTTASNALGMGLATTAVLVCSNAVISSMRKIISDEVRLPAYIVIIAGFVTIVSLVMEAYMHALYSSLGLFLSLIVVNCIILGRAEMFANKNAILPSVVDGLGMGIGFTLALLIISTIREVLGSLSWYGISLFGGNSSGMLFFIYPAGAFFVLGIVTAVINVVTNSKERKTKSGCSSCPSFTACGGGCEVESKEVKI